MLSYLLILYDQPYQVQYIYINPSQVARSFRMGLASPCRTRTSTTTGVEDGSPTGTEGKVKTTKASTRHRAPGGAQSTKDPNEVGYDFRPRERGKVKTTKTSTRHRAPGGAQSTKDPNEVGYDLLP